MRPQVPEGFTAVRIDRQGKKVAVVARSAHYDRPTPVSRGGYWVLLSDELGTTWLPPLYTDLRDNLPYTVRATSTVPLLAGHRLQVEVEVKELPAQGPAARPRRQPVTRGGCCQPAPGRSFGEQTLFVVGERPMFAGLRPSHRLIVLAPEEAETLRRTVSDPFSLTFDLVVLDRSGRRAFVVWSTANADARRLLLEERG